MIPVRLLGTNLIREVKYPEDVRQLADSTLPPPPPPPPPAAIFSRCGGACEACAPRAVERRHSTRLAQHVTAKQCLLEPAYLCPPHVGASLAHLRARAERIPVQVHWAADNMWYDASIVGYDPKLCQHTLLYSCDGQMVKHRLWEERVRVVEVRRRAPAATAAAAEAEVAGVPEQLEPTVAHADRRPLRAQRERREPEEAAATALAEAAAAGHGAGAAAGASGGGQQPTEEGEPAATQEMDVEPEASTMAVGEWWAPSGSVFSPATACRKMRNVVQRQTGEAYRGMREQFAWCPTTSMASFGQGSTLKLHERKDGTPVFTVKVLACRDVAQTVDELAPPGAWLRIRVVETNVTTEMRRNLPGAANWDVNCVNWVRFLAWQQSVDSPMRYGANRVIGGRTQVWAFQYNHAEDVAGVRASGCTRWVVVDVSTDTKNLVLFVAEE
jgi:hypothetical protein